MTSDEGNIQDEGKDTDKDNEEELNMTGDNINNNDGGKILRKMTLVRTILRSLMTAAMR